MKILKKRKIMKQKHKNFEKKGKVWNADIYLNQQNIPEILKKEKNFEKKGKFWKKGKFRKKRKFWQKKENFEKHKKI